MNSVFITSNRIASWFVLAVSLASLNASSCFAGSEKVLYDVDFNGPPHVIGAEPAYGFGQYPRRTPTEGGQIFSPSGSATVVNAFWPMINRPVRLQAIDGTPNDPGKLGGVDLQSDLDVWLDPQLAPIDRFHASVDVVPSQLRTASGLGIFFDAPSIHSVQFWPDGFIRVIDATGVNQIVGQHFPESIYHVQMAFDRAAVEWSASINGVPVYHGPAHGNDLDRFRIAMTTGDALTPAVVAVDNIRITGEVPEPASICLTAIAVSGLTMVCSSRRRR